MKTEINLISIKVLDRIKEAGRLQQALSKYSSLINTRFGYHELNDLKCSRTGLIILELRGTDKESHDFIENLQEIGGIIVKVMTFKN
ncbi:MAG: hypothetical protein C0596_18085 [Marinilabiliales bacterium]|nr:MAG: hypothetical protein C0596_18085 [Marinilabiliales bacterium]